MLFFCCFYLLLLGRQCRPLTLATRGIAREAGSDNGARTLRREQCQCRGGRRRGGLVRGQQWRGGRERGGTDVGAGGIDRGGC